MRKNEKNTRTEKSEMGSGEKNGPEREREGGGVKRRRLSGNFNSKVVSFQP